MWFSAKWDIPAQAYRASIRQCAAGKESVPQWYVVQNENREIVAGAGVIENDFHDRNDLAPNVCALFVEEAYRGQGIARSVLDAIRQDLSGMGTGNCTWSQITWNFYEKCGWKFRTLVIGGDGLPERLYESGDGKAL